MTPRPTDDAAFLHGLFQGIARTERECYGVMAAHGAKMRTQILTAGGGANLVWTAIRPVVLGMSPGPAQSSGAAVGTARLVLGAVI
jgi:sugar (pentulose or hexulose) kinase